MNKKYKSNNNINIHYLLYKLYTSYLKINYYLNIKKNKLK